MRTTKEIILGNMRLECWRVVGNCLWKNRALIRLYLITFQMVTISSLCRSKSVISYIVYFQIIVRNLTEIEIYLFTLEDLQLNKMVINNSITVRQPITSLHV